MVVLKSNCIEVRCLASNLARHYYVQEFGEEIDIAIERIKKGISPELNQKIQMLSLQDIDAIKNGDFKSLAAVGLTVNDFIGKRTFPALDTLKIVWAMNKASRRADNVPQVPYETWLEEIGAFNVLEVLDDLDKEIEKGFFREAPIFTK